MIMISNYWNPPAVIAPNHFKFKSLSDFSFNTAIGCAHGCRFCYVPSVATKKQAAGLAEFGVQDPDAEWGEYVLVRRWDEKVFLKSLRAAENMAEARLKPGGHRAVMFCSTTDPYQTILNSDPEEQKRLNQAHRQLVRRALELIRDRSTLNVRILTRSPLAKADFELMASFGHRLTFGMSLPTLNDGLAKVFEPGAPGVAKRLETLKAAKKAGLHVYVAVAPTYPDCDEADIRATLTEVAKLDPITVFHEPINIRAENVERIRAYAREVGREVDLRPFETKDGWRDYSVMQLKLVERIAGEVGLGNRLHLWPDKDLVVPRYLQAMDDPAGFVHWCSGKWTRVSEWPKAPVQSAATGAEDKAIIAP